MLVDLDADQCADLLASAPLGRLAVIVDGRPEIFPVNHVFDRDSGCILFPSNAGTKVHAALSTLWVAFEADGVSDDGSRGWSVLMVGHAETADQPEAPGTVLSDRDRLWRAGSAECWIRIVPSKVTGRRICAADRAAARSE